MFGNVAGVSSDIRGNMNKKSTLRVGAVVMGLAIFASACSSDKKGATATTTKAGGATTTAAAGGGVKCDGLKLGFVGALSGPNGALGTNMVNGAQIALDDWNSANPDCKISLDARDSTGDGKIALPLATALVGDAKVVGLIGPGFSGETKATMPTFEAGTLPMITPGATNAKLSTNGWKMFHRILANDDKQAPGVVKYIQGAGAKKVGVIDDASEYGKGLADSVRSGLGALKTADAKVDPKASDFSAAVNSMKAAGVDLIFYGGYYAEAAKLVTQLRDAGITAKFVSGDGSLDPAFIKNAGDKNAEGVVLTATGAPSDVNKDFADKFMAKFKTVPALYSPEAYDCAKIFLDGIAAGKVTRADLAAFVSAYDKDGITKHIKFDATGEPAGSAVFYTVVEGGKLVAKGLIK